MTFIPQPDGDASLRILVVDDNEDAGEMLRMALMAFGYAVEVSHDGPAALVKAESFHPHVALLDIGLPSMDGYEVARRLRELPLERPLRMVAVTGYGGDADRERAAQAGFDHYLVKPVDLARLRSVVDQASADVR